MTITTLMPSPDVHWRVRAACSTSDPELFFPAADAGPDRDRQVAEAKAVCASCPVRSNCLDESLAPIPHGIAGGMTPEERHATGRCGAGKLAADELVRLAQTRAQVAAAGAQLLAAGRSTEAVARVCGVSERTAYRWRARASYWRAGCEA